MSDKHSVAMFVTAEDGTRTQVGWASPKDESGVRTFEYSPGYESTRPKNVSFEDDELSQEVAEEQAEAQLGDGTDGEEFEVAVYPAVENTESGSWQEQHAEDVQNTVEVENTTPAYSPEPVDASPDASQDAERVEDAPDPEFADEETDASLDEPVELSSGGIITETSEDEEAEFQRLLAEEKAAKNEEE